MNNKINVQIDAVLLVKASLALQNVAIDCAKLAERLANSDKRVARYWVDRYNDARRTSIAFDNALHISAFDFSALDERMDEIMDETENE